LSPVQVAVLSISEKTNPYAQEIADKLKATGLRVEANLSSEKIGAKIRTATMEKVPYMLVLGEKEQQAGVVAVRHRTEGDKGQVPVEAFIEKAKAEIASKALASPAGVAG
jgi:threonyl-tRNA synthetase